MDYLLSRFTDPFLAPFAPSHRVYWLYLCTALAVAFILFVFGRERGAGFSLRSFLGFCFPRSVYLHKSALVDYRYFVVNRIAFGLLILPVVAAVSIASAAGVTGGIYGFFGEPPFQLPESHGWIVIYTVLAALAMDFGLFLAHYLQHRVPLLWEFHKVHHSAQVLTPITAYRMHPVDDLLSMSMAGLLAGAVFGVFNFLQPGNPGPVMVLGLNLILFLFYVAGYNLRHSHIWLSYGPVVSRIFISPAQHQIHHSKAPQHFDKNFGFIFACWDGWFGSLYVPQDKEGIEVGLPEREDEEYSSIRRLYFLPFVKGMSTGVRTASVGALGLILLFVSSQSVMAVHAAITRGVAGSPVFAAVENSDGSVMQSKVSSMTSVFLEDLTWVEVRTLIVEGATVVIIPTGGTEQNGPHVILGKHNYIVRHSAEKVARALGNALVAPVIGYVPEGNIDPPSGHMRYPGTLSVSERVFEAVLEETARSLKAHGFKLICFLGDSGGNQRSQQRVASRLNREWRGAGVSVLHVEDYYFRNGQTEWLTERGETKQSIGNHAGIRDTSELMYVKPEGIRQDLLAPPGASPEATGADGDPSKASKERGEMLVQMKVAAAVRQIREELSRLTSRPANVRKEGSGLAVSL